MRSVRIGIVISLVLSFTLSAAQDKRPKAHQLFEAAEAAYNDDEYAMALSLLDECLRHFPAYYEAYSLRGSVREILHDFDGALTDYSIYLEAFPEHFPVLMSRAILRYKIGFFEQARDDFQKLLTLDAGETNTVFYRASPSVGDRSPVMTPQSGYASYICNYLGLIEAKLNNHRQALIWYDSALRLNPNEPDYYVNRGLTREALRDSSAASDYRAALELNATHTLALHNLKAWEAREAGLDSSYEDRLTETILRDSTMLYPYLERAQQRFEGGYYKGAEEDYTSALALEPDNPEIWLGRGLAREKQKNYAGAFADYTKAIDLKEDFFKAWVNRGNVLFRMGRYNAAIEDFTVAIVYREDFAPAYFNRAMARARLKDKTAACQDLLQAEQFGMTIDPKMKEKLCQGQ